MDTESIELNSYEDTSEIKKDLKLNKQFKNSTIFLNDSINEKSFSFENIDEELNWTKRIIEKPEDTLPLKEAIANKKSKLIGFFEKYITHKFLFNLIFVIKVTLGIFKNYFASILK